MKEKTELAEIRWTGPGWYGPSPTGEIVKVSENGPEGHPANKGVRTPVISYFSRKKEIEELGITKSMALDPVGKSTDEAYHLLQDLVAHIKNEGEKTHESLMKNSPEYRLHGYNIATGVAADHVQLRISAQIWAARRR